MDEEHLHRFSLNMVFFVAILAIVGFVVFITAGLA